MQMQSVVSSDIKAIGYDENSLTLRIEFNSGGVYEYFAVPASVHSDLMNSSSHGKYFHQYIRDKYDFRKIS